MLVICIMFLACTFAYSLLTYLIFWYENANDSCLTHQRGRAPSRLFPLMLGGIFSSFLSLILVIPTYPLGFFPALRRSGPNVACPLPPIILIHGLYHNAGAWLLYRRWLKRKGFVNIYEFTYKSWNTTFFQILKEMQSLIKEVNGSYPGQPVVLIGHSLGGLLCRACVEQSSDSLDIAAVVTLAAPHQGTKLSVFGVTDLARSLAFRGPLIRELENRTTASTIPRLTVFSPADNMVLPCAALRVPFEGWLYHETTPISHLAMLYHRPTAGIVTEFIKTVADHGRPAI